MSSEHLTTSYGDTVANLADKNYLLNVDNLVDHMAKDDLVDLIEREFTQEFTERAFQDTLKKLPGLDRSEIMSKRKLRNCFKDFERRKICPKCWTKQAKCICHRVQQTTVRHNIMVYMHYREFGRQTNTGKLLTICCPHSQMYVSGLRDQEEAMVARLRANPKTSFVLFPAPDSISVQDFLSRFAKAPMPTEPCSNSNPGVAKVTQSLESLQVTDFPPLNIVIIDGTWNQAKHLVYNIPAEVPRVHINPTSPSLFLLRKQSQSDRICTLEASSMLLHELEGSDALFTTLIDNLKLSVDSVLKDRGLQVAYGKLEEKVPGKRQRKLRLTEEKEDDEEDDNEQGAEADNAGESSGSKTH